MKPTTDELEWARKTVAAEDYLPWADVEHAKRILGLPIEGLTDAERAAYAKAISKQCSPAKD